MKNLPNLFNNKKQSPDKGNNMNRSILKQLNKNLSKNHYVRKIKSGEVFFGVQLTPSLQTNPKVMEASTHCSMEVQEDGEVKIVDRDRGFSKEQLQNETHFIVKLEIKPKLKQEDDYTFSIKVEDIEIIEDDNNNPGVKVYTTCLMPIWIDGEIEQFKRLQSKAIERVTDDVLGIIVNSSDLEFSSVHYAGDGRYIDFSDRKQMIKDLPKK